MIQQAIEAEFAELMERFANVKTLQGQRAVVRNGYLPEREVLTAAGPIAVKVPKVRFFISDPEGLVGWSRRYKEESLKDRGD